MSVNEMESANLVQTLAGTLPINALGKDMNALLHSLDKKQNNCRPLNFKATYISN